MTLSADSRGVDANLSKFDHGINRIAVSPDESLIATSDVDMNVQVERDGEIVFRRNFTSKSEKIRPMDRVRGLAFGKCGTMLYIAAGDRLRAVSTETWREVWSYVAPKSFGFLIISPMCLDIAADGRVIVAFDNGTMKSWTPEGKEVSIVKDNDVPRWLTCARDNAFVMGSDTFSVCRWHIESGEKERIQLRDRAFGFAANSTCRLFAVRTLAEISIWDFERRSQISSIKVDPCMPMLSFHPTKDLLVCGEQNRVRVLTPSGDCLEDFEVEAASVICCGFTMAGQKLLLGCTDARVLGRNLT